MILNTTTKARDRYRIINDGMGCHGDPISDPTHHWSIAEGVDRGNGYQGYMSLDYFFQADFVPRTAKATCCAFLRGKKQVSPGV